MNESKPNSVGPGVDPAVQRSNRNHSNVFGARPGPYTAPEPKAAAPVTPPPPPPPKQYVCMNCKRKWTRLKPDGSDYRGATMNVLDPNGHFCETRCAIIAGVRSVE